MADVLGKLFRRALSLRKFVVEETAKDLLEFEDLRAHKEYLENVFVGLEPLEGVVQQGARPAPRQMPPLAECNGVDMAFVIADPECGQATVQNESVFRNDRFWSVLLRTIGVRAFRFLLAQHLFVTVKNRSGAPMFLQVGGPPIKLELNKEKRAKNVFQKVVRKPLYLEKVFTSKQRVFGLFGGMQARGLVKKVFCEGGRLTKWMRRIIPLFRTALKNVARLNYYALFRVSCVKFEENGTFEQSFTPVTSVLRFLWLSFKRTFPSELIGSEANLEALKKNLLSYLTCKKQEYFKVAMAIEGIRLSEIPWVGTVGNNFRNLRRGLAHLMDFLFSDFFFPLLREFFLCTDTASTYGEIVFYRRDVWNKRSELAGQNLVSTTFTEIETAEPPKKRMRLLPKKDSVRPLMRCWEKEPKIAKKVFAIVSSVFATNPEYFSNTILSNNQFFPKYLEFVQKAKGRKLYFAKCDVYKSYDTINQDKLLECLKRVLPQKEFADKFFWRLHVMNSRTNLSGRTYFLHPKDSTTNDALSRDTTSNPVVFSAAGDKQVTPRDKVFEYLGHVIKDNIVRYRGKVLRQKVGIAQGSRLSVFFASIVYACLEEELQLPNMCVDENDVFLFAHYVDDFLLISTSEQQVRAFLDRVYRGFPEYGCAMNPDKTITNLDGFRLIPWCGKLFNPDTLEVRHDLSRFHGLRMSQFVSVRSSKGMGSHFIKSMICSVALRCGQFFVDGTINSKDTVATNIFQAFLVCALKFCSYAKTMRHNPEFFKRVVQVCIRSATKHIQKHCANSSGFSFPLRYSQLRHLAHQAFATIFRKHNPALLEIIPETKPTKLSQKVLCDPQVVQTLKLITP